MRAKEFLEILHAIDGDVGVATQSSLAISLLDHLLDGDTSILTSRKTVDIMVEATTQALLRVADRSELTSEVLMTALTAVSQLSATQAASLSSSAGSSARSTSTLSKSVNSRSSVTTVLKTVKNTKAANASKTALPTYPITVDSASSNVTRAVIRPLSDHTKQNLLAEPKPARKYKYCNSDGCNKCERCFSNVPLTKCNHGDKKCTSVGLYPHLSRATWKKLHSLNESDNFPELICYVRHFSNPHYAELGHVPIKKKGKKSPGSRTATTPGVTTRSMAKEKNGPPADLYDVARNYAESIRSESTKSPQRNNAGGSFSLRSRSPLRELLESESGSASVQQIPDVDSIKCQCGALLIERRDKDRRLILVCSKETFNRPCPHWARRISMLS